MKLSQVVFVFIVRKVKFLLRNCGGALVERWYFVRSGDVFRGWFFLEALHKNQDSHIFNVSVMVFVSIYEWSGFARRPFFREARCFPRYWGKMGEFSDSSFCLCSNSNRMSGDVWCLRVYFAADFVTSVFKDQQSKFRQLLDAHSKVNPPSNESRFDLAGRFRSRGFTDCILLLYSYVFITDGTNQRWHVLGSHKSKKEPQILQNMYNHSVLFSARGRGHIIIRSMNMAHMKSCFNYSSIHTNLGSWMQRHSSMKVMHWHGRFLLRFIRIEFLVIVNALMFRLCFSIQWIKHAPLCRYLLALLDMMQIPLPMDGAEASLNKYIAALEELKAKVRILGATRVSWVQKMFTWHCYAMAVGI